MDKRTRNRITRTLLLPLAAGCFLGAQAAQPAGTAAGSQADAKSGGTVIRTAPVHTESMQKLTQAAQKLRESIQALAQKPAGKDRDAAMQQAQSALLQTQQAMLALPPDMRSWGTASTVSYDDSVKKMMKAADALRDSVQAMAQRSAGSERNNAIRAANEALLETQSAMVTAYAASSAPSGSSSAASSTGSSSTMGAGASSKPAK